MPNRFYSVGGYWANVCPATGWALPVASVFDATGFRYDSSSAFTFSWILAWSSEGRITCSFTSSSVTP